MHVVGLGFHLPAHPHGDEKVLWLQLQDQRGVEVTHEERLLSRCYPGLIGCLAAATLAPPSEHRRGDVESLRRTAAQDILGLRALVAVLSAGIVPATWLVARRFLGARWALLAAGLASFSTISAWYSSMARPHAVVAAFVMGTVAASLRARESGRIRDFVLAGVLASLAFGSLHSGACAWAAIAAAWWWCARPRMGRPLAGLVLASTLLLAAFLALLRGEPPPDLASGGGGIGNALLSLLGMGVHGVDAAYFDGRGFQRLGRAALDYEPVLTLGVVLAVGGLLVRCLRRSRWPERAGRAELWTAAAHPGAHLVLFGAYGNSFQRFWLPLIPAACLLAAYGAREILARTSGAARRWTAAALVLLGCLQIATAAKIVVLRSRETTHELAAAWIEEHAEAGTSFVGQSIHLPLVPRDATYRGRLLASRLHFVPWFAACAALDAEERALLGHEFLDLPLERRAQRDLLQQDPEAYVTALGPCTVLLERAAADWRGTFHDLRGALLRQGRRVAEFDPQPRGVAGARSIQYLFDGPGAPERWFWWSILWAERLGPAIEAIALQQLSVERRR